MPEHCDGTQGTLGEIIKAAEEAKLWSLIFLGASGYLVSPGFKVPRSSDASNGSPPTGQGWRTAKEFLPKRQ